MRDFDYSEPPPEGALWSIAPIKGEFVIDSDTRLDDYIGWVASQLPTPIDATPLRANAWTLNQLNRCIMNTPEVRYATEWPTPVLGSVEVELDTSLPDGVIMQGDKVLCNVEEQDV